MQKRSCALSALALTALLSSYGNTGLSPATFYSYRVRAYNGAGNSGYSNTATARTKLR